MINTEIRDNTEASIYWEWFLMPASRDAEAYDKNRQYFEDMKNKCVPQSSVHRASFYMWKLNYLREKQSLVCKLESKILW